MKLADKLLALGTTSELFDSEDSDCAPLIMESLGDFIGPYRLLQQIGAGGFGIIWRAEQLKPIHREVALKLTKPGMDSADIVARFSAERQALGMMEHPNIAKVLDAGATATGRPYSLASCNRSLLA